MQLFTSAARRRLLDGATRYIAALGRARTVEVLAGDAPHQGGGISALSGDTEVHLAFESEEAAKATRARLHKQLMTVTRDLASLDARLSTEAFLGRAPAEVVEADRARQRQLAARRETIARYLTRL